MNARTPVSSSRLSASEASKVIIFPLSAPQQRADFPRPFGAVVPTRDDALLVDDDELEDAELLEDVAAAVLVLRAAQRGHVTPGEAIEAALIRLGGDE